jgi:hypothetical protein
MFEQLSNEFKYLASLSYGQLAVFFGLAIATGLVLGGIFVSIVLIIFGK